MQDRLVFMMKAPLSHKKRYFFLARISVLLLALVQSLPTPSFALRDLSAGESKVKRSGLEEALGHLSAAGLEEDKDFQWDELKGDEPYVRRTFEYLARQIGIPVSDLVRLFAKGPTLDVAAGNNVFLDWLSARVKESEVWGIEPTYKLHQTMVNPQLFAYRYQDPWTKGLGAPVKKTLPGNYFKFETCFLGLAGEVKLFDLVLWTETDRSVYQGYVDNIWATLEEGGLNVIVPGANVKPVRELLIPLLQEKKFYVEQGLLEPLGSKGQGNRLMILLVSKEPLEKVFTRLREEANTGLEEKGKWTRWTTERLENLMTQLREALADGTLSLEDVGSRAVVGYGKEEPGGSLKRKLHRAFRALDNRSPLIAKYGTWGQLIRRFVIEGLPLHLNQETAQEVVEPIYKKLKWLPDSLTLHVPYEYTEKQFDDLELLTQVVQLWHLTEKECLLSVFVPQKNSPREAVEERKNNEHITEFKKNIWDAVRNLMKVKWRTLPEQFPLQFPTDFRKLDDKGKTIRVGVFLKEDYGLQLRFVLTKEGAQWKLSVYVVPSISSGLEEGLRIHVQPNLPWEKDIKTRLKGKVSFVPLDKARLVIGDFIYRDLVKSGLEERGQTFLEVNTGEAAGKITADFLAQLKTLQSEGFLRAGAILEIKTRSGLEENEVLVFT